MRPYASVMIKTNLAATNHQDLLVLHLPGKDQRASALDFGVLVMRHYVVVCGAVECGCSKDFQTLAFFSIAAYAYQAGPGERQSAARALVHVKPTSWHVTGRASLNLSRGSFTTGRHLDPTPRVSKLRLRHETAACGQSLCRLDHPTDYLSLLGMCNIWAA